MTVSKQNNWLCTFDWFNSAPANRKNCLPILNGIAKVEVIGLTPRTKIVFFFVRRKLLEIKKKGGDEGCGITVFWAKPSEGFSIEYRKITKLLFPICWQKVEELRKWSRTKKKSTNLEQKKKKWVWRWSDTVVMSHLLKKSITKKLSSFQKHPTKKKQTFFFFTIFYGPNPAAIREDAITKGEKSVTWRWDNS